MVLETVLSCLISHLPKINYCCPFATVSSSPVARRASSICSRVGMLTIIIYKIFCIMR